MTGLVTAKAPDFAALLTRLAPRGDAWPDSSDAVQQQAYQALMGTMARLNDRANFLVTDAFPATTEELLPQWEASLGLPDPCAGVDPLLSERQAHVVARLVFRGGQSVAFFIAFAATLGFAVTVQQFVPARFGAHFGSSFAGTPWAFAWQVTVPTFTVTYAKFGAAVFGDPYSAWGNAALFCEMRRMAPARSTLLFSY